jgi:hypothetical protein
MEKIMYRTQSFKLTMTLFAVLVLSILSINKNAQAREFEYSPLGKAAIELNKSSHKSIGILRLEENQNDYVSKALTESAKPVCCSGGVCKVRGEEYSCNQADNSLMEVEPQNAGTFTLMSDISRFYNSITEGGNTLKGTNNYCEKCFDSTYKTRPDYPVSLSEAKENIIERVKIKKLKQKMKKLAGFHFKLKSYYKKHKDVIDRVREHNSENSGLVNSGFVDLNILKTSVRENDLCLPFRAITRNARDQKFDDNYETIFDKPKVDTEKHACDKNSKKMIPEVVRALGLDANAELSQKSITDEDMGATLNNILESYAADQYNKVIEGATAKNLEDSQVMIDSFYKSLPHYLSQGHGAIKSACKNDDEYERRSLILPIVFKNMVQNQQTMHGKLKQSINIVEIISIMDPDISPFISSTDGLCDYVNTYSPEQIEKHDIAKNIKLAGLDSEEKEMAIYKQFTRMRDVGCDSIAENITELMCSKNDAPSKYNLYSIDSSNLPEYEKVAMASLNCIAVIKTSIDGYEGIDIYALNDNAFSEAVVGAIDNSDKLVESLIKVTNKSEDSSDINSIPRTGSVSLLKSSKVNERHGKNKSEKSTNVDVASSSTNDSEADRNFIMNGEQVLAGNKGNSKSARSGISEGSGSEMSSKAIGGSDSDIVVGSGVISNQSSIDGSTPERQIIPSGEEIIASEENDFNSKMSDIISNTMMNSNSSSFGNNISKQTVADMIEAEISQTEVMETLNEDENIAEQYTDVKDRLKDQLAPGEDVNAKLQNVLTGEEELEKSELTCKLEDKTKCEGQNSDLLAEIEKLKAQVAASAKATRAEAVQSESDKRIKALEEELAKFKQIASAKVDSTSPSTTYKSSAGDGSSSSKGSISVSGSDGKPLFRSPSSIASSDQISKQAFKGDKIITNIVKSNPEQFIDKKDFDLALNGNNLVLTIDAEQIKKAPVSIDRVILDSSGQVSQIIIAGGKPISMTTLSTSSRSAVEKFIASNKDTLTEQTEKIKESIVALESIQVQAKADSVRYNQLLCEMDTSRSGCVK